MDELIRSIAGGHNRDRCAHRVCAVLVVACVALVLSSGPAGLDKLLQRPAPAAAPAAR